MALPTLYRHTPLSSLPLRTILERRIVERREREARETEKWRSLERYHKDLDIQTKQVDRWISDGCYRQSMEAYMKQVESGDEAREMRNRLLSERREKLRELLEREKKEAEVEKCRWKRKGITCATVLKLKDDEEAESKRMEERERIEQQEKVICEQKRKDEEARKNEEMMRQRREENDRILRDLIERLRLKERECDEMKDEEVELMDKLCSIHKMDEKRRNLNETWRKFNFNPYQFKQARAKLKRLSLHLVDEIRCDLDLIHLMGHCEGRRRIEKMVEQQEKVESGRFVEIDKLEVSDLGKLWSQRWKEWDEERRWRERAVSELLDNCLEKMEKRVQELQSKQRDVIRDRELMMMEVKRIEERGEDNYLEREKEKLYLNLRESDDNLIGNGTNDDVSGNGSDDDVVNMHEHNGGDGKTVNIGSIEKWMGEGGREFDEIGSEQDEMRKDEDKMDVRETSWQRKSRAFEENNCSLHLFDYEKPTSFRRVKIAWY